MQKRTEIAIEPLTAEAFEPFGQIIGRHGSPPVFSGPHIDSWRMDFGADGPVELMFSRYVYMPMEFGEMERHFNVTQSFVPLGDSPSVMVVAPRTGQGGGPKNWPRADSVRAFYVSANQGILLWKGTWHALTRFPARPPFADFALITGQETQSELERQRSDGTAPVLTEVCDFTKAEGIVFNVIDPRGLIAGA